MIDVLVEHTGGKALGHMVPDNGKSSHTTQCIEQLVV